MLTENGPTSMQIDYVLPDRMHQKVTVELTNKTSEVILVGNMAWSRQDKGSWHAAQSRRRRSIQEPDAGLRRDAADRRRCYACKGRTKFDGRDVLSYKLENEPEKGSTADKSGFPHVLRRRLTGLPVSNALLCRATRRSRSSRRPIRFRWT